MARIGESLGAYRVVMEELKEKDHLEDLGVDRR